MPTREEVVSSTAPEWTREAVGLFEWAPARQLLRSVRRYAYWRERGMPRVLLTPIVLLHRFWSAVTSAEISLGTHIEGGLLLPHPAGIVVHPDAVIGPNCLLMQGVTIGVGKGEGVPVLEGGVDVSAGACVLGDITIGKHALIGANAVVTTDVPPYAVVVGVPGRVARIRDPEEG